MQDMNAKDQERLEAALRRLDVTDFLIFGVMKGRKGFWSRNDGDAQALTQAIFKALKESPELRAAFTGMCEMLMREKVASMAVKDSTGQEMN